MSLLELPHNLAAPQTLARLRPLHRVVIVAYVVFRFATEAGKELGEEVVGLSFVHLLEVGHPLIGHFRFSFCSYEVVRIYPPSCCHPSKLSASDEGLFTEVRRRRVFSEVR